MCIRDRSLLFPIPNAFSQTAINTAAIATLPFPSTYLVVNSRPENQNIVLPSSEEKGRIRSRFVTHLISSSSEHPFYKAGVCLLFEEAFGIRNNSNRRQVSII